MSPGLRRKLWSAGACLLIGSSRLPRPICDRRAGAAHLAAGVVTGGGLAAASFAPSTAHALGGGAISDSAGPGRDLLEAPCAYCTRLRRSLRDDREIVWVNVWVDGEANQEVRRHNRGNEYTPTALVGDQVLRNPTGEDVRSALSVAG